MTDTHQPSSNRAEQASAPATASARPTGFLVCGIVAGPLFFLVFTVAGWLRPFYDPLRHPISSLEFGPQGWIQALNFIVTGTLVILFAWAVRSPVRSLGGGRTVPVLLMAVGLGLIGAGLVDPDPISGYPPGTPPIALHPSMHRVLHDWFSTPVFTALPAACIVLARRFVKVGITGWAVYSASTAALMMIFFVLSSIAFGQGSPALTPYGGLLQRSALGVGFAWLSLLAVGVSLRFRRFW
jgi:Protein of unknown function (DUF998)